MWCFGGKKSLPPKVAFGISLKSQFFLLFSLFLLLFMGPIALFGTIYRSHSVATSGILSKVFVFHFEKIWGHFGLFRVF